MGHDSDIEWYQLCMDDELVVSGAPLQTTMYHILDESQSFPAVVFEENAASDEWSYTVLKKEELNALETGDMESIETELDYTRVVNSFFGHNFFNRMVAVNAFKVFGDVCVYLSVGRIRLRIRKSGDVARALNCMFQCNGNDDDAEVWEKFDKELEFPCDVYGDLRRVMMNVWKEHNFDGRGG